MPKNPINRLTKDPIFCYYVNRSLSEPFTVTDIILMQDNKKKDASISGVVVESLPNTFFRVKRDDNGEEMLTYLSGKMRLHRIKVLIGDKVMVEIDPYGGKGRIVKRI